MQAIEKMPSTKALIRFSDCDPFNHLNNSGYIDYYLNAREDQLQEFYAFNVYAHAKETGFGWVVGQHEIAYLKPAFTNETVLIESMVIRWGERDILVEFKMWNEDKTKLKSLMWTKFFYYNLATQKSHAHPPELNERFAQLVVSGIEINSFEKRLQEIKEAGQVQV